VLIVRYSQGQSEGRGHSESNCYYCLHCMAATV
jgi:hypothetical protein